MVQDFFYNGGIQLFVLIRRTNLRCHILKKLLFEVDFLTLKANSCLKFGLFTSVASTKLKYH